MKRKGEVKDEKRIVELGLFTEGGRKLNEIYHKRTEECLKEEEEEEEE